MNKSLGVFLVLLAPGQVSVAQVKPKVVDLRKPSKPDSTTNTVPRQSPKSDRTLTKAASKRTARSLAQTADRLGRAAQDSFRRGLIPTDDFILQLELVLRLQETAAQLQDSPRMRSRARTKHELRLADAAKRMTALNQPAAKGWKRQIALLELHVTRARARAMRSPKANAAVNKVWNERVAKAAKDYHQEVIRDHKVGLANDRMLADSIVRLAIAVEAYAPRESQRAWKVVQDVLDAPLRRHAAASTRTPELAHLKAVRSLASAKVASANGKKDAQIRHLKHAELHFRAEFQRTTQRLESKTASLFQVARSWADLVAVSRELAQAEKRSTDLNRQFQDDRKGLLKTVAQIKDRRGRIASDINYVTGLAALAQIPTKVLTPSTSTGSQRRPVVP